MKSVKNAKQILANVRKLYASLAKKKGGKINAQELLMRGRTFVRVDLRDGVMFAPSRYVGYINNDVERHLENLHEAGGGETNIAISKVLGEPKDDKKVDREFVNFCRSHRFLPNTQDRRYWILDKKTLQGFDASNNVDEDEGADENVDNDLKDIEKSGRTTVEKRQLRLARLGQGKFRRGLLKRYKGRCAVTGCETKQLLRASHIIAWSECERDADKIDVSNGLLLIANLDAAFDKALISFDQEGQIMISRHLSAQQRKLAGIEPAQRLASNRSDTQEYLAHHRKKFRANEKSG